MRLVNLCSFLIVINGEELATAAKPLIFTPRLVGEGVIKTLIGYEPPPEMAALKVGTEVIVPRFASAIAAAKAQGLVPLTVPLRHFGDRGAPNAGRVVLDSADELEPAPEGLAVAFPTEELPGAFAPEDIQRMTQGAWTVKARGVGEFPAVQATARDFPDGTATIPTVNEGAKALIVPATGPCVRAAAATGLAVLILGVPDREGFVDLYRVA